MRVAFKKRAESIFSKGIQYWPFGGASGPYCHTELVFSDGVSFSSNESDGGSRFTTIGYNERDWDFLDVPLPKDEEQRVRAFCAKENGCGYDWLGLALSFSPVAFGYQSENKWFCSEVCTAALQVAGYCSGFTPVRVSPNRLYKILSKELK